MKARNRQGPDCNTDVTLHQQEFLKLQQKEPQKERGNIYIKLLSILSHFSNKE